MNFLHPYTLPIKEEQKATWQFVLDSTHTLISRGWEIINFVSGPSNEYEKAIKSLWGRDDLMILEQDNVPLSVDQLFELEACPHDICCFNYPICVCDLKSIYSNLSNGPKLVCYKHNIVVESGRLFNNNNIFSNDWRWSSTDDEYNDYYSFGLVRFRKSFMEQNKPGWAMNEWVESWRDLDSRVSKWSSSLAAKAHVHRPLIRHNHSYEAHQPFIIDGKKYEIVSPDSLNEMERAFLDRIKSFSSKV